MVKSYSESAKELLENDSGSEMLMLMRAVLMRIVGLA